MKRFQLFRYLKKFQIPVVIFSVLAAFLFYNYAEKKQTYKAATVIQYTNPEATSGFAPDNTEINTSEINSSKVMAEVFTALGLDYAEHNLDDIRSRISIEPIVSEQATAIQEALNETGETYDEKPTEYTVTFTANSSEGKEFARNILSTLLDVYSVYYSENHVNQATATNATSDIYQKGYDYLEMMEVIDESIQETLDLLQDKINNSGDFRAVKTGYSFIDIWEEFDLLQNSTISNVFADILANQVTKDQAVLIAKYENRIKEYDLKNIKDDSEVKAILKIVDSYVKMMKKSDNTDITNDYILDQVYDNYYTDPNGQYYGVDRTVEYDVLLQDYVDDRTAYEHDVIDAAYCQYVIDIFKETQPEGTDMTAAQKRVEADITNIVRQMNALYEKLDLTNDEYNQYLGAENISILTSVGVQEAINIKLYALIALVGFLILGCIAAVILGRTGDIVEYFMFTDHTTELPNRNMCDRYISGFDSEVLPQDFACIAINITNLREQNEKYGRKIGDKILKSFSDTLKNIYKPGKNVFIGYNGTGQFLVFITGQNKRQVQLNMTRFKNAMEEKLQGKDYSILFKYGVAESEADHIFHIRELLTKAVREMNQASGSVQEPVKDAARKAAESGKARAEEAQVTRMADGEEPTVTDNADKGESLESDKAGEDSLPEPEQASKPEPADLDKVREAGAPEPEEASKPEPPDLDRAREAGAPEPEEASKPEPLDSDKVREAGVPEPEEAGAIEPEAPQKGSLTQTQAAVSEKRSAAASAEPSGTVGSIRAEAVKSLGTDGYESYKKKQEEAAAMMRRAVEEASSQIRQGKIRVEGFRVGSIQVDGFDLESVECTKDDQAEEP